MFPRVILVPDLDAPLSSTSEEDTGEEGVPLYVVYRCVVTRVGVEVLRGVLRGAEVDQTLVSTHQIDGLVIGLEC